MRIANDCVVSIRFTLTNEKGQELDRSPEGKPLEYLHGAAGILPELERHLSGKAAGDSFDITITPDRGFGDRQPGLVEIIPLANWSDPAQLAIGLAVTRTDPSGATQNYIITAIDADAVTVDGNHPLAGMTLRFQGTVVGVRAGTAEELASL
ncbi:MAG: peptidylprolyl isomerase [Chromatiales bacterium]|nr:peptidylprolyl isomerase [Chromatiales bacterium]